MYAVGLEKFGCLSPIFIHAIRRYCSRSHYQVLGLKQTASTEDIRSAFIEQSKKLHPDLNKDDPDNHKKFVRLNEAYTVLSKAASRHDYDQGLTTDRYTSSSTFYHRPYQRSSSSYSPEGERMFWDETIWHMRDKSKDKLYEDQPYYGIKGIERVSNSVILYGCVFIIMLGAVIHYFAIKKFHSLHRAVLDEKGRKNLAIYNQTRQTARENGLALQLDILEQKMKKREKMMKNRMDKE